MGFLAPWALAGILAVGLPVWLHLLRKHKTTPLPFASLMFFERRTQSSIKHRRLQYLLLLALRAAVIALLAFAFARPFLQSRLAALAGGPKLTVLAIDNSFSMRDGDHLARAKQAGAQTAARLGAGDKLQVLAFGAQVHVMGDSACGHSADRAYRRAQFLRRAFPRIAFDRAIGPHAGGSAPVLRHAKDVAARQLRGLASGRRRAAGRRIRWRTSAPPTSPWRA